MKKTILVAATGIVLSACGGGSNVGGTTAPTGLATNTPEIGAAINASPDTSDNTVTQATDSSSPDENTTLSNIDAVVKNSQSLEVSDTFAFDTARTVDVDFDLEQARDHQASVSICTTFDPLGGPFDVDYDSCTVQGQMINGMFHHSMEVTNDIDSVAAVVWFQDNSMQPMMQIFPVEHQTTESPSKKTVMSAASTPRIVWR